MMNMMNTTSGFGLLWILHILSVLAFFTGFVFLIVLAIKTLTNAKLKSWALWLIIGGAVVCLFTIGMTGRLWTGYGMSGFGSFGMMPMMWGNTTQNNPEEDAAQAKEETEGKAIYDKLQAKQVTCANLADSDFELIGEYVMGQKLGAAHGQMNDRIKQMMGTESEEQMHISLGKNATGCTDKTSSFRGMMQ